MAVFLLGYKAKDKQSEIIDYAGEQALDASGQYIKYKAIETKDWFGQMKTYWNQVWKK